MFILRASPVFLGEMNGTATPLVRPWSSMHVMLHSLDGPNKLKPLGHAFPCSTLSTICVLCKQMVQGKHISSNSR